MFFTRKNVFAGAVAILMISSCFVSCSKDSNSNDIKPIEGLYVGHYGFGNDSPNEDYKLNVKAGGVIQEIGISSGAVTGKGTWQLDGDVLSGTYTMVFPPYNVYSVIGTFNPSNGKLVGTWGFDENPTDGGKMDMKRQ